MDLGEINTLLKEKYSFDGFTTEKFDNFRNEIHISLKRMDRYGICPECKKSVRAEELIHRKVRGLDMIKPCYFIFKQARIRCKCGYRGMEKVDFAERYSRYTKRFEQHIALMSKRLKAVEISKICGLDLKTIKSIKDSQSKKSKKRS